MFAKNKKIKKAFSKVAQDVTSLNDWVYLLAQKHSELRVEVAKLKDEITDLKAENLLTV
ncbi:hypothetical protein GOV04_00750 [Candidatus Woesearchaeota archaeon]|nr:hypothetical protein [Candidatus Woesearchaeota archaeon]